MTDTPTCPFDESRRLTGINFYFDACGAVLEVAGDIADAQVLRRWREGVERMAAALGWPSPRFVTRKHASGVSLAFSAPPDQLYTATEVNEWALLTALPDAVRAAYAAEDSENHVTWHEAAALQALRAAACAEQVPGLTELAEVAEVRGLNLLSDEDTVTLGSGEHGRSWPLRALPTVADVDWSALADIPIVLVTGSNGKTTTTRLLASMTRARGWRTAYSSTDGVFADGRLLEAGDYSGPSGARQALRQPEAAAAVLETARGGILRHGLGLQHARVAVVTTVSDDHFGEYGIHDLEALAEVKLVVARALHDDGLLITNADEALLARHALQQARRIAWFALDDTQPQLQAWRRQGASTCAVRDGRLRLVYAGREHDLGAVASMPLTANATARYNVANIAAASLAASAMGVEAATIAEVLTWFGSRRGDNPGRLQQWSRNGVHVLLDYAHNPDALRGLLQVVEAVRGNGRLGMVLGHAGNREDDNLRAVAAVAAEFRPDRVLLKEIAGYERGRAPGEVAEVLRQALAEHGYGSDRVAECPDEYESAAALLAWARPGDVLVLPILNRSAREQVSALLDAWQAGHAPPPHA